MMGCQLRLDFASGLQNDTNYDDDGVAAERKRAEVALSDDVCDHRNHSDDTQEDGTDQSDAVQDLVCRIRNYSPKNPLYIVAIGAITNIASAIE